jgi:hypothetical protein
MRLTPTLLVLFLLGCGQQPPAEPSSKAVTTPAVQAVQAVERMQLPPAAPIVSQPAPVVPQADLRQVFDELRSLRADLGRTVTRVDQLEREADQLRNDLRRARREGEGGKKGW